MFKQTYLTDRCDPKNKTTDGHLNLGVMAMKEYFTFFTDSKLELYH